MTRQHAIATIARRLRPAPDRFAAAAALYDPNPLLQLQAAGPGGSAQTCARGSTRAS